MSKEESLAGHKFHPETPERISVIFAPNTLFSMYTAVKEARGHIPQDRSARDEEGNLHLGQQPLDRLEVAHMLCHLLRTRDNKASHCSQSECQGSHPSIHPRQSRFV
ncbi:hypothetical protein I7I50_01842 [Histoplasma capsulatum G186AR]|uniref:Uncharacterized protein n=1 Tax=Ajellomyces capsulatus TaxID=5037 RepID=A0A8H7YFN3_AJECA|nr:hypothetical protein I7I52_12056 [Histoplasma capsulatum]QSS71113.1 hypothetical protein I7I50_01842 [Histoplasma capsulatum G186AR]